MDPGRAEEIAHLVVVASARYSSDWDLFDALVASKVKLEELAAVGKLVPELALYPGYVNGYNALRRFEKHGLKPELKFSLDMARTVARDVRRAAEAALCAASASQETVRTNRPAGKPVHTRGGKPKP